MLGLVLGLAVLAVLASSRSAAALDERDIQCGAGSMGNEVRIAVDLPSARSFWAYFPAALGAPELENDLPARLVVFEGDYTWFRTGEVFRNVVCVHQDGYPHIYPNVSFVGSRLGH